MTKTLTQDVFKDAPDWVKSTAVDENGEAWLFRLPKVELQICSDDGGGFWDYKPPYDSMLANYFGSDYDTTNWQNSAIDRE